MKKCVNLETLTVARVYYDEMGLLAKVLGKFNSTEAILSLYVAPMSELFCSPDSMGTDSLETLFT